MPCLFDAVDEGIAPLASASEPDLPLSRHPAPQSPDPLAWTAPLPKSLERSPFTAPTRVSSLPLGCLRRLWAYTLLLATRSFRRPSPRQPIRGITLGLCFEGVSSPRCHPVGTCSREPTTRVPSFLTLVLRVRRVLLSAGFHGGEPGSPPKVPSPKPCPFGREPILQRSLVCNDDSSSRGSLPTHRRLLSGIAPSESERTRFSSCFTG